MAKNSTTGRFSIVGGNRAAEVNPLGLVKKFKAVCVTEHKIVSPEWRNTKAEAMQDAQEHINKGHHIDFDTKISKP